MITIIIYILIATVLGAGVSLWYSMGKLKYIQEFIIH